VSVNDRVNRGAGDGDKVGACHSGSSF
jgi:hypothetical protein